MRILCPIFCKDVKKSNNSVHDETSKVFYFLCDCRFLQNRDHNGNESDRSNEAAQELTQRVNELHKLENQRMMKLAEFCRHLPRKSTNEFLFQCECGLVSQRYCCECRKLLDTTKTSESFKCGTCDNLICNRCVLDCTRKSSAACCDTCAKANTFRFDAKLWCVVLRMFFVDNLNNLTVENHVMKTLFRSTRTAIDAVPIELQALYPNSELVDQLLENTKFPLVLETQNKEVLFTTDNVFFKGSQLRIELQMKLMINDVDEDVLPSQMKT